MQRCPGRGVIAGSERGVAGPHGVVQGSQRLRNIEVVIHGRSEGVRNLAVAGEAVACRGAAVSTDKGPYGAGDEPVNPFHCGGRFLQRSGLVVQHRAVLRLAEVVPNHAR
ncbi:hypothetical protein D9M72_468330 [compost metagenome]